jgi:hypothetical protein
MSRQRLIKRFSDLPPLPEGVAAGVPHAAYSRGWPRERAALEPRGVTPSEGRGSARDRAAYPSSPYINSKSPSFFRTFSFLTSFCRFPVGDATFVIRVTPLFQTFGNTLSVVLDSCRSNLPRYDFSPVQGFALSTHMWS